METLTLISALLSIFCWISSSVGDFRTVEVLPGEEVTMLCSNFTNKITPLVWYRLTNNESSISSISAMFSSDSDATLHAGFQNGRFTMTSNNSHIFLNIKQVDLSDVGLYFCGHKINSGMDIFNHTYLKMQACRLDVFVVETLPDSLNSTYMLLGGLIVFLLVVIVALVFKIRSLLTGTSLVFILTCSSDGLNYAAVSFQHRTKRGRRRTAERELEPHVVYAATR
uniref:Immunoglobulin domain-containing protein n=1 Tax=Salarias fasciatus TaxID=181472 RepID=A0A672IHB0_SALFA